MEERAYCINRCRIGQGRREIAICGAVRSPGEAGPQGQPVASSPSRANGGSNEKTNTKMAQGSNELRQPLLPSRTLGKLNHRTKDDVGRQERQVIEHFGYVCHVSGVWKIERTATTAAAKAEALGKVSHWEIERILGGRSLSQGLNFVARDQGTEITVL